MLVLREIGMLTLVAAIIGLPPAAFFIERYLSSYIARAPMVYSTMLFAVAATLIVALLAILRHTWIAMRMSPTTALRVSM
jgi:hypothetical protein